MSLRNKTILVTGGAGFIGSHIAQKLIDCGAKIIIVDNFNKYYDPRLKRARIKILLAGRKYKIYRINIANFNALKKVFKQNNIDLVCHQAAQAGVRYSIENPFMYEKSNVSGTMNLLELATTHKVKGVVIASSSSVYGNTAKTPFEECAKTECPVSIYAATKKSCELLGYAYHKIYGLRVTLLRYFTVYGPWGRPDMALFKFTKAILENNTIELYNHGNMKRDFTYIDDIVRGVILALKKNFPFEIINLGAGRPQNIMKIIKILEGYVDKKATIKFLQMQNGDVISTHANIKKARQLLGWEPRVGIETGVKNFVDWYKKYYNFS